MRICKALNDFYNSEHQKEKNLRDESILSLLKFMSIAEIEKMIESGKADWLTMDKLRKELS